MHAQITPERSRVAFRLLVLGTILAALLAAAVPANSINSNRTGRQDRRGFPLFYTDDTGLRLRLCETGTVQCQRATRRTLTPPAGENFYWMATAHIRSTQGPIDVEFALEAAFGGARGRLPIVFERIRIRGHLAEGTYVLDHPYGSTRFRATPFTDPGQRNVDFTRDRACSRERGGTCNGMIDNFLRATNPPKGYVGFGGRRTTVRGGTLRNDLVLSDGGGTIGQTDRIAVLGKRFLRKPR
ncbi:MAG TPA: hypothetical protein VFI99_01300 [Nocardioides sp.]|nr:hypothetical protein [Nocardioides sp.]